MKNKVVGILGYGGAIGKTALNLLKDKYIIRGGQRSLPENIDNDENFTVMQVNVYDEESLKNFCKGCDVVLNCAGPSYKIKDRVAKCAIKNGADYVDLFGADALENQIISKGYDKEGTSIISAGNFPGLSGILLMWLAKEHFDSVDKMTIYSGGMEKSTKSACADVLLSSINNFGNPGCLYKNGEIIKNANPYSDKVFIPGFKNEVYIQDFINIETIKCAEKLNVKEAQYLNIINNSAVKDGMGNACSKLILDNSEENLNAIISKVNDLINMSIAGNELWYSMVIEMEGLVNNEKVTKRLILKSNNSYELSGITAACAVERLLEEDLEKKVYWPLEVLDGNKVIEKLRQSQCVKTFEVVDITVNEADEDSGEVEEGML